MKQVSLKVVHRPPYLGLHGNVVCYIGNRKWQGYVCAGAQSRDEAVMIAVEIWRLVVKQPAPQLFTHDFREEFPELAIDTTQRAQ